MAAKNLSYLMKHSLRLKGKICETHPEKIIDGRDFVDCFSIDEYRSHPHTYCVEDETIVFVDCSTNVFVTPYTRKAVNILNGNGFSKANYFVPFQGKDFPTDYEYFWKNLQMQAVLQRDEEFYEDCRRYSSLHGIGELNEEELLDCIRVPIEGILIKRQIWYIKLYPMILDLDTCKNFIGNFEWRNGICYFIHFDGKTYVTTSKKIGCRLKKIGYVKGNVLYKLRKYEKTYKEIFQNRWEILSKI